MSETTIASDGFSSGQRETLAALFDTMIPESQEYGSPSAAKPEIVADFVRSIQSRSLDSVRQLLDLLDAKSASDFTSWNFEQRLALFNDLQRSEAAAIRNVAGLLLQCYYRDDVVLESLGMRTGPPFPQGNDVEQGDWSLLDPVRARGSIYREV